MMGRASRLHAPRLFTLTLALLNFPIPPTVAGSVTYESKTYKTTCLSDQHVFFHAPGGVNNTYAVYSDLNHDRGPLEWGLSFANLTVLKATAQDMPSYHTQCNWAELESVHYFGYWVGNIIFEPWTNSTGSSPPDPEAVARARKVLMDGWSAAYYFIAVCFWLLGAVGLVFGIFFGFIIWALIHSWVRRKGREAKAAVVSYGQVLRSKFTGLTQTVVEMSNVTPKPHRVTTADLNNMETAANEEEERLLAPGKDDHDRDEDSEGGESDDDTMSEKTLVTDEGQRAKRDEGASDSSSDDSPSAMPSSGLSRKS